MEEKSKTGYKLPTKQKKITNTINNIYLNRRIFEVAYMVCKLKEISKYEIKRSICFDADIKTYALADIGGMRIDETHSQKPTNDFKKYKTLVNYLFDTNNYISVVETLKKYIPVVQTVNKYRSMLVAIQYHMPSNESLLLQDNKFETRVKNIILDLKFVKLNKHHEYIFRIICDRTIHLAQQSGNIELITWLFSNYNENYLNNNDVQHLCEDVLDIKYHNLLKKYLLEQSVTKENYTFSDALEL